jgi:hypothetical protein
MHETLEENMSLSFQIIDQEEAIFHLKEQIRGLTDQVLELGGVADDISAEEKAFLQRIGRYA